MELDESKLKEFQEVRCGFLDDYIAEEKRIKRASDKTILKAWLKGALLCASRDVDGMDEKSSKKVTEQCADDMKSQGADERLKLGFIELALALDRPVAPEEYSDLYRSARRAAADQGFRVEA